MARKLYVGNLPYETNDQDLSALFATAGEVEAARAHPTTAMESFD